MEFDLNKGAPNYSQPVVIGILRLMDSLPAVLHENPDEPALLPSFLEPYSKDSCGA